MTSNSERFIAAFNSIEKALKKELALNRHFSFVKIVDLAKKKNSIVAKYEHDLKDFAELRNAIVHERTEVGFIIAEPHLQTVEKIELIKQQLIAPEKVIPKFKRKVVQFHIDDLLTTVLASIKEYSFTQFPVYENGEFVGIITENGIVRWLSQHIKESKLSIELTTLNEVMKYERHAQDVIFVDKDTKLPEVKELFVKQIDKKRTRLNAVLITKTGANHEPLLGIITPYDVIQMN